MNPMELMNGFIDVRLRQVRTALTQTIFLALEKLFILTAGYTTPLAAAVGVLIGIVIAIKIDSFIIFSAGILWIGVLIFCYYIGSKARLLCLITISNNQSSISNQAFLDIGTFISLATALSLLVGGIYFSIKTDSLTVFLLCIGGSVAMAYLMWLMLQPQLISIGVEPSTSAGMDGISIVVLVYKMYLRISTVLFGVLPAVGTALLVHALYIAFGNPEALIEGGIAGVLGFVLVLGGLLAPVVIYISFIISYLFFDVLRSILMVGKLASLISSNDEAKNAQAKSQENALPSDISDAPKEVPVLTSTQAKRILIGILGICLAVFLVIQGNAFYTEFQAKQEAARIAEERKQAEEELAAAQRAEEERRIAEIRKEESERMAREAQIASELLAQARKHIGGNGLDLLLEPLVYAAAREALNSDSNMQAVENFIFNSENVIETDGLISVNGCSRYNCDAEKVIITVDSVSAKVGVAVKTDDRIFYFGYSEADSPSLVKKWVISLR